ncbi:phage baseplate protein [Actinobacillus seminis]|uniref:phage baseplate protein n=1 Tax=Actinobacillus seminis TaxID=722 RepID=UPI003B944DD0
MAWSSIGVPSVPGLPKNIGDAAIKFGGAFGINAFFGNYWGIFNQNGIPLLLADNVKSVKYQNKSKISTAPLEMGSFAAYNKVVDPYIVDVVMTKGSGGVAERGAFLALIDTFANSTDLYMVITPESIYPNCNIIGYDYVREAGDGARLLKVNLHLQEIREVEVQYLQTEVPQSGEIANHGEVSARGVSAGGSASDSVLLQIEKTVNEKGLMGTLEDIGKDIVTEAKNIITGNGQ